MKGKVILIAVVALWIGPLVTPGGTAELDLTQPYLLLATRKISTMQEELTRAAAAGYRVVAGSRTSGTEMALILEKTGNPIRSYEYAVLATNRTSTMQKELSEAAARGFRLLPDVLMPKKGFDFTGTEIVAVMEKAPDSTRRYQYLLLATTLTSTLQKEISEAVERGFRVVGMMSRGEHIVVLERQAPPATGRQP